MEHLPKSPFVMDVIYHLVEDEIFESHMAALFNHATRFVLIYSSNCSELRNFLTYAIESSPNGSINTPTWKRQALDVQQIANSPPL